ncbi:MAG: cytochrome c [Vicinamibacteria bacterium]|jgi:cytochrome c553
MSRMSLLAALLLGAAGAVVAQGIPYGGADVAAGRTLSQKDCVGCHARKFDGDATRIYTRPDRKVRNPEQLLSQVQLCNSELNLQYFPDDEANIAAYLDREHYRFSK